MSPVPPPLMMLDREVGVFQGLGGRNRGRKGAGRGQEGGGYNLQLEIAS